MVTASEQDAILKLNGAEMEEILVMKIVLENVNFTVELQNKSSDEFIELREKMTETVFFFRFWNFEFWFASAFSFPDFGNLGVAFERNAKIGHH